MECLTETTPQSSVINEEEQPKQRLGAFKPDDEVRRQYFIRKGLEDVEVSCEEYYRESEKLFRIKLMVMDHLGVHPLTRFSDLSRTKQTRYRDLVMKMMDDLTYEEVIEQSGDVIDDVFSTNPRELPIKLG